MAELLAYCAPISLFAFAALISPGPNNILVAAVGANYGGRQALRVILSVSLGVVLLYFIVSYGLGNIFERLPAALDLFRWLSFGFIVFLATMIVRASAAARTDAVRVPSWWQVVLFQWVNPKAWAMGTLGSTFLTGERGVAYEAVLVSASMLLGALPCLFIWGFAGANLGPMLRSSETRLKIFNWAMAALMVASFIPIVLHAG